MEAAFDPHPDEITALRQALAIAEAKAANAEQKHLDVAAELAVAKAIASDDKALIAHQKPRIAKLERQVYGPRKERGAQLQHQMELELEELDASATEDESPPRSRSPGRRRLGALWVNAPNIAPPFQSTYPESAWSSIRRWRASAAAARACVSSAKT
jgi:hypothetical protein